MKNLSVCANTQCLVLNCVFVSIESSGNAEFSITAVPGEANMLSMGALPCPWLGAVPGDANVRLVSVQH